MSRTRGGGARRAVPYLGLLALLVLHHDAWLWDAPRLVLGLPAHLLYHVGYCVVVAAWMAFVIGVAWPHDLDGGNAAAAQGPAAARTKA
jgi:hypothetical protein